MKLSLTGYFVWTCLNIVGRCLEGGIDEYYSPSHDNMGSQGDYDALVSLQDFPSAMELGNTSYKYDSRRLLPAWYTKD